MTVYRGLVSRPRSCAPRQRPVAAIVSAPICGVCVVVAWRIAHARRSVCFAVAGLTFMFICCEPELHSARDALLTTTPGLSMRDEHNEQVRHAKVSGLETRASLNSRP